MRTFLLLLASLISLLFIVGLLSVFTARRQQAQAEEFLGLIAENKLWEAFDSTTTGFQRDFGWEPFSRYVRRFHLANYQRGSARFTGGRTLYTAKLGFNLLLTGDAALRDGTHFQTTFRLRREGGLWKVNYIYVKFPEGTFPKVAPTPMAPPLGTDAAFKPKALTLAPATPAPRYLPPGNPRSLTLAPTIPAPIYLSPKSAEDSRHDALPTNSKTTASPSASPAPR